MRPRKSPRRRETAAAPAIRTLSSASRRAPLPGSAPGTCFAGPHFPWSPPLAPPTPLRLPPADASVVGSFAFFVGLRRSASGRRGAVADDARFSPRCWDDARRSALATIAFSHDLDPDPGAAFVALRRAGFEVTMMPEKFRSLLAHPEDDFMEVSIEGTDDDKVVDAIINEINTIVDCCGGLCFECGPIPSDRLPFEDFDQPK
jgi:hypothetical protein